MHPLAVLVFNCDTNPCKAEEVWQPASPDEEVTELSIMALVGPQFPLLLIYIHVYSSLCGVISLTMDLSLLISTTVTLFRIDIVKIRILVSKLLCYIK